MTGQSRVTQLGYVTLGVSDLTAWRDFAVGVLALEENGVGADGSLLYRLDDYHHRIALRPSGEDDLVVAGWQVTDAPALREIERQVRGLGVEVEVGTAEELAARKVLGLIKFLDPTGLQVEVYFGPLVECGAFRSPRGGRGFKAGDLGLGHVVLHAVDVEGCLSFYMQGLGVEVSDWIRSPPGTPEGRAVFTRVNARHHSLALGTPPDPTAATIKHLNHFMLELNALDDVGLAFDAFRKRNLPSGDLGRHANDRTVSFYAPTPSGFMVEHGWDGRLIHDSESWEVEQYQGGSIWGHGMPTLAGQPA